MLFLHQGTRGFGSPNRSGPLPAPAPQPLPPGRGGLGGAPRLPRRRWGGALVGGEELAGTTSRLGPVLLRIFYFGAFLRGLLGNTFYFF